MNPEIFENPYSFGPGQIVVARFTNSGRVNQFVGKVIRRTKNDWKILAFTSPYESEAPGRIFSVATHESRIYSSNNRIVRLANEQEQLIPEPEARR